MQRRPWGSRRSNTQEAKWIEIEAAWPTLSACRQERHRFSGRDRKRSALERFEQVTACTGADSGVLLFQDLKHASNVMHALVLKRMNGLFKQAESGKSGVVCNGDSGLPESLLGDNHVLDACDTRLLHRFRLLMRPFLSSLFHHEHRGPHLLRLHLWRLPRTVLRCRLDSALAHNRRGRNALGRRQRLNSAIARRHLRRRVPNNRRARLTSELFRVS